VEAVAAIASSAAMLEGYRRAMSRQRFRPPQSRNDVLTLTDIVENATERAQGLAPRLRGIGVRIDMKV
jgi:hypothetical protein